MSRVSIARAQRRKSNPAESAVWRVLRAGKAGQNFRRQVPIGPYVVDFACLPLRLAIEIDGGIDQLPEVALRDFERQKALEDLDWTVLRFTEDVALSRPTEVVAAVERHAAQVKGRSVTPDPHPAFQATFSQWEKEP